MFLPLIHIYEINGRKETENLQVCTTCSRPALKTSKPSLVKHPLKRCKPPLMRVYLELQKKENPKMQMQSLTNLTKIQSTVLAFSLVIQYLFTLYHSHGMASGQSHTLLSELWFMFFCVIMHILVPTYELYYRTR